MAAPAFVERLAVPPRQVPISLAIVNVLNWSTLAGLLVFGLASVFATQIRDWPSPRIILLTIFAITGLIMIAGGLLMGRRRNTLLRAGPLEMGTFVAAQPTDPNLEDPDYELTFEFKARDANANRAFARVRTNDVFLIGRLQRQPLVPLLFDPGDPSRAYLLEAEPARPRLDQHGYLRGRMFAAVARLVQAVVIFAAALYAAGIMSQR